MLPGFRFLFAATVLSISMLIFGLGAAALLRAAHEEFASIPSRRSLPEVMFTQQSDDRPTLAILRVAPSVDEKTPSLPATEKTERAASPDDQPATAFTPPEPENPVAGRDRIAALTDAASPAEQASAPETQRPETSAPEIQVQAEAPAQSDASSAAAETKIAAIAETPAAASQAASIAPEQASAPIDDSTKIAETKIATLGGPPVSIETQTPSKLVTAVVRKTAAAKRVTKRRKIAPRARLARPAPQQPANPFGG